VIVNGIGFKNQNPKGKFLQKSISKIKATNIILTMEINRGRALKDLNYQFDSIGACSITSFIDENYGELKFHWEGNRKKIRLSFINSCVNCICETQNIIRCKCSWIAFQEGEAYSFMVLRKRKFKI